MKKNILVIALLAIFGSGCGSVADNGKPSIGYNDTVNQELYSFEEVVSEDDYNKTLDSYSLECDGNNGVLLDDITKTERGYIYSTFVCVEKN